VRVYLDGEILPREHAKISPFDRGFLFGDGVYEGLRAFGGRVFALDEHADRLAAGIRACRIGGFDPGELGAICRRVLEANELADAFIYVQVSRGTPGPGMPVRERLGGRGMRPTVFAYAEPAPAAAAYERPGELSVATRRDVRWELGWVKGVSLLGNVMAAYEACEAGAEDAILVRGWPDGTGLVSEGLATNTFLSINGRVVTPSLNSVPMLEGVTRRILVDELGREIEERPVTLAELGRADEIALVGTRTMVARVSRLDDVTMGDVGMSRRLLELLKERIAATLHSQHG